MFSEADIPEEFYTRTSDMLLVQPEPQFPYAQMFLGALSVSLGVPMSLGLPGRDIPDKGAAYSAAERDRLMLSSPMFTDVFAAKVNFNAEPGASIRINRPVFTNTTYTEASRRIVSGSTVSTTAISYGSQQANLQLFGYGGPFDTANSRVAPFAVSKFDAMHSVHSAVQMTGTHLKRDCHRFLDAVQVSLLDLAANTVFPEGISAANDITTAGSAPLTFEQVSRTEAAMDTANLPTFADGFRVLFITPGQLNDLQLDGDFQRLGQFFPEYNALFPQYVRSVGKFHIFKSTTLTTTVNSSSVNVDFGHAIAPGALLAGMGQPLRVTPNTNDNYGRDVLVIWQGDLAFGLANSSFVYRVASGQ